MAIEKVKSTSQLIGNTLVLEPSDDPATKESDYDQGKDGGRATLFQPDEQGVVGASK